MPMSGTRDRMRNLINRLQERLWVKPLLMSLLSVAAVFLAKLADSIGQAGFLPELTPDSVESLLSVMASGMLVIATLAVASMVSAYASATNTATPRSFRLIIADDVSQNALSTFIGAFIFSIVALTAAKNDYFGPRGLFALFVMTVTVFAIVVLTFVRWVDRIARLGRIGATIETVEGAASRALCRYRDTPAPAIKGMTRLNQDGEPVYAASVGYVQHVDIARLQTHAEEADGTVLVAALPGTFVMPGDVLAYLSRAGSLQADAVAEAFSLGKERHFEDDPRFGLVVLSEIASRALSPAVNDPGTGIDILGRMVRLLDEWNRPAQPSAETGAPSRVAVVPLRARDLFEDAFGAIARDGAGMVEVCQRLQKGLRYLATSGNPEVREAALYQQQVALKRAEKTLMLAEDIERVRIAAGDGV